MRYDRYQLEDFLADPDFVRWVRQPNAQRDAHWQAVLRQYPHQQTNVARAKTALLTLRFDEEPVTNDVIDAEWQRFRQKSAVPETDKTPVIRLWPLRQGWRVAATIAVVLTGLVWWKIKSTPVETVYKTGFGQLRTVRLPDNTEVTLNANSMLRYSPGRAAESRQVWLDGEAFFRVSKKWGAGRAVKFTVQAGDLAVEVLGTEFNVYHRSKKTQVVLEEGNVRLRSASTAQPLLTMKPGDAVVYLPETKKLSQHPSNPQRYKAWRSSQLVFDNTPLSEVAELIRTNYGKSVVFLDSTIANRRLSGTVPSDDLNRLTTALSRAFGLRITARGDELLIDSQ